MKTQFYFPAPVEVVKVTNENLAEVAEWCGGKVASTESRRVPGRMDSYVWVPTPKGNSMSWAFPGMYITKRLVITVNDEMKATYAVFRRDYFSRNYFDTPSEAVEKTWEKENKKKNPPKDQQKPVPTPKPRPTYKSKAEIEKENDMEQSPHGYPVLTEEEAAAKKDATPAPPETVSPDATETAPPQEVTREITEGQPIGGDAFAGGQQLDGGPIMEVSDETPVSEVENGHRAPKSGFFGSKES